MTGVMFVGLSSNLSRITSKFFKMYPHLLKRAFIVLKVRPNSHAILTLIFWQDCQVCGYIYKNNLFFLSTVLPCRAAEIQGKTSHWEDFLMVSNCQFSFSCWKVTAVKFGTVGLGWHLGSVKNASSIDQVVSKIFVTKHVLWLDFFERN